MSKLLRQLRISGLGTPDDFEAANRRQQIYGGSFDTVVLELRILEPRVLDEQLALCSGLPTAAADLLTASEGRPWDAIPPALIDLGWAMPLARRDGKVHVAVHPEIPDDQLDLIRDQPGLELLVTAECCLARLGSERTGSLTPQRYAVLAASYIQGIGGGSVHSPSASVGAPWKAVGVAKKSDQTLAPSTQAPPQDALGPTGPIMPPPSDPAGAPRSWLPPHADDDAAVAASGPSKEDAVPQATLARVTPVPRQPGPIEKTPPPPSFSLPKAGPGFGGRSLSYSSNSSSDKTKPSFSFSPPPPRGETLPPAAAAPRPAAVPTTVPPSNSPKKRVLKIDAFDPTDLRRRFEAAKNRDEVTDILLAGAHTLMHRVVLLAIRKSGLKWLAASERDDEPAQATVPLSEALYECLHNGAPYLRCDDPALQAATEITAPHPCALLAVAVANRPVLAVYIDADGVALDDDDVESVRDLTQWAGIALTRIVRTKAESRKHQSQEPRESPIPATLEREESDSISLTPLSAATPSKTSTLPPLVVPKRQADAPLLPLGSNSPIPAPQPRVVTPPPAEPISPKVPRLIDGSPPRSSTLISTQAPGQAPKASSASGSITQPPIRDLGAPVTPGASRPGAPTTIPPVRTPSPPIRAGAPPVRMPPARDGTLSPQIHVPDSHKESAEAPPEPQGHDDTLIPTHAPVPPAASMPPAEAGAPPVRHVPPVRTPPRASVPPASRTNTLPGTQSRGGLTPLGSPLMQPPGRGRLVLDDEDRHDDTAERSSERIPREVLDQTIDAAMSDPTAIPALLELGEPALSRLAARFPGPIDIARRDLNNLPPLSAHGQLIRLAVQLGQRVSPMLRELLGHPDQNVRFYAAFTFQELRDETALDGLATRAFDSNGDVRAIAMRVLETYSRAPSFSTRIAPIREQLASDNLTRQIHAARAVGTLRDVHAVPALIDLLDHPEKRVRDIGLESLCSITGQQLGSRSSRWRSWYEANAGYHRIEWVMGALSHKDAGVRGWASIELRRITGQPYALPVNGSKREREQVIKQWTDWWKRQGREKFVGE